MSTKASAGGMLKTARKEQGITLQQLSKKLGIEHSTISRREARRNHFNFLTMLNHYAELGINPLDYYGITIQGK